LNNSYETDSNQNNNGYTINKFNVCS